MASSVTSKRRIPGPLQLCGYAWRAAMMLDRHTWIARGNRGQFYRDAWREAAAQCGASFEELPDGGCRITRGAASTQVRNNTTTLDDSATYALALDKPRVLDKLKEHELPIPDHVAFSINDRSQAYRFLERYPECVVKPASGTGAGRGVTTGVKTRSQLFTAAVRASGWGPHMLIEQQVRGDNLRLLYLDGELIDAIRRNPPSLIGDGKSSIAELVSTLNRQRISGGYRTAQVVLRHDMDMRQTLASQQLSWNAVPEHGRIVRLKTVINDNRADENERIVDQLAPEVVESGRRAAEVLGVRLAGVDVITPDLTRPLEAVGGIILEMNTAPGYYFHYFTANGPCRVAEPVLEACLADAESARTPDQARTPPREKVAIGSSSPRMT